MIGRGESLIGQLWREGPIEKWGGGVIDGTDRRYLRLVGEVSAQLPDILEDGDVVLAAVVPELAGGETFLQDQRRP